MLSTPGRNRAEILQPLLKDAASRSVPCDRLRRTADCAGTVTVTVTLPMTVVMTVSLSECDCFCDLVTLTKTMFVSFDCDC